jgi:hypothetical protein
MYGNRNARWDGDRLYLGNRLSGFTVVRDERYPTMSRVRAPDGTLSDMVNRTRAKDAAVARAVAALNGRETGAGAPHAA